METRKCTKCGAVKPYIEFSPRRWKNKKNVRTGLTSHYKVCVAKNQRERTKSLRIRALQEYSGSAHPFCCCCGETEVRFLCLDHINGGGDEHRRSLNCPTKEFYGTQNFYRQLHKLGYPPGIQVQCHNCNAAKGASGVCPHQEFDLRSLLT